MSDSPSSVDPFERRFVEIDGVKLAYLDEGRGPVVLFLHGNPTSSYLWRNVVPHVMPVARCIAPDLPGFGRSDKPDIEYRVADHAHFVEAFIATLGLHDLVLVLHDWGSALGFDYARRHEGAVSGMAFMEFIAPFPTWLDFPARARDVFRAFRTPGVGRALIVEQNAFIERVLPGSVVRGVPAATMAHYRAPFLEPTAREPMLRFPNEIPIAGEPIDVYAMVCAYHDWLLQTELPKLMFKASPGALISEERARWYERRLRNCMTVDLGPGVHYLQEDNPAAIGEALRDFVDQLAADRSEKP
ncbi:MAG: haloalkane dehalogenase [Burkholderiales bacterium]